MQLDLPPRLEAMIQEKVDSGENSDPASVIAEALRLLAERGDRQEMERLRAALQVGIDQIERDEVVGWTPELHGDVVGERAVKGTGGQLAEPGSPPVDRYGSNFRLGRRRTSRTTFFTACRGGGRLGVLPTPPL